MKNLLFVDDEPNVLQGLQRQLRSMRNEWEMNFVAGGAQALEFMRANRVDVIITDITMPGMDGSQLLNEIVARHPDTVRIVLSGHAEREAVLRLVGPAHLYLSKPSNAEELRNAIARAVALRDLLGNENLKQLATRVKCLPSLPALLDQLTEELKKDEPSVDRIGEIMSRDIGMSTKILQLVNSAYFGLQHPVHSLREAVTLLGLATVRSLALSLQVFSQYDQSGCEGFSLDALASHCWITGVAARRVAREEQKGTSTLDQCFLAGLVHDVGELVLATGLPEEYQNVIQTAKSENRPTSEVEQEFFWATHADVGAYLLGLWGLPDPIIEAVALHHEPARCVGTAFSPLVAVHVADSVVHEQDGGCNGLRQPAMDMDFLTRLGFNERVETWREACRGVSASVE